MESTVVKYTARSLTTVRNPLEPSVPGVHHQQGHNQRSAVMYAVVWNWGHSTHIVRRATGAAILINCGLRGQVGQESHLHPAVVESDGCTSVSNSIEFHRRKNSTEMGVPDKMVGMNSGQVQSAGFLNPTR